MACVMILCRLKHASLALVVLCGSCGLMDDNATHSAFNGKHDWFEYAYYSSSATLEDSTDGAAKAKPLKLQ